MMETMDVDVRLKLHNNYNGLFQSGLAGKEKGSSAVATTPPATGKGVTTSIPTQPPGSARYFNIGAAVKDLADDTVAVASLARSTYAGKEEDNEEKVEDEVASICSSSSGEQQSPRQSLENHLVQGMELKQETGMSDSRTFLSIDDTVFVKDVVELKPGKLLQVLETSKGSSRQLSKDPFLQAHELKLTQTQQQQPRSSLLEHVTKAINIDHAAMKPGSVLEKLKSSTVTRRATISRGMSKSESVGQVRRGSSTTGSSMDTSMTMSMSHSDNQTQSRRASDDTPSSEVSRLDNVSTLRIGLERQKSSRQRSRELGHSKSMSQSENHAQVRRASNDSSGGANDEFIRLDNASPRSSLERQTSSRRRSSGKNTLGRSTSMNQSENHAQVRRDRSNDISNGGANDDCTVFSEIDWSKRGTRVPVSTRRNNSFGSNNNLGLSMSQSENHAQVRRGCCPQTTRSMGPRLSSHSETAFHEDFVVSDHRVTAAPRRRSKSANRAPGRSRARARSKSRTRPEKSTHSSSKRASLLAIDDNNSNDIPVNIMASGGLTIVSDNASSFPVSTSDSPAGTGRRRRPSDNRWDNRGLDKTDPKARVRRSFSHKASSARNLMSERTGSSRNLSQQKRASKRDLLTESLDHSEENHVRQSLRDAPTTKLSSHLQRTPSGRAESRRSLLAQKIVANTQVLQAVADEFDHIVSSRKKSSSPKDSPYEDSWAAFG